MPPERESTLWWNAFTEILGILGCLWLIYITMFG
jgi:hypothetical protein